MLGAVVVLGADVVLGAVVVGAAVVVVGATDVVGASVVEAVVGTVRVDSLAGTSVAVVVGAPPLLAALVLVTVAGAGVESAACSLRVDEHPPSRSTTAVTVMARRPFITTTVEPGCPAGR